ncbi:MAG: PAS domain S-box protein, partial [Promethearchaeota archaeon]
TEIQEIFRNLYDKLQFSVLLVNQKRTIIYCNPTIEKLFGYQREELIDKDFIELEIFTPKLVENLKDLYGALLKGEFPEPLEFQALRKDKNLIWINILLTLIYIDSEPLFQVMIQDITKRKKIENLLQESEERFRLAFENAIDTIIWVDPKTGIIINCNRAAERLLEKSRDEIIGQYQTTLHPPEKAEYYSKKFKNYIEQEEIINDEAIILTKSRKSKPVYIDTSIITVGEYQILQGIFHDISDWKQTESALRERELRYRTMFNASPDFICLIDTEGNCLDANQKLLNRLDMSIEELRGKSLISFFLIENYDELMMQIATLLDRKEIKGFIASAKTPRGQIFEYEINLVPLIEEGKVTKILNIARDITERKRAEAQFKESEERYNSFFNQKIYAVFINKLNGDFLDVNETALKLLGYTREEILSLNISILLGSSQYASAIQYLKEIKEKGFQATPKKYIMRRKDGGIIWIEIQGTLINRHGKPYAVQGIARDITERKRTEEALHESEKQYRSLIETMNDGLSMVNSEGIFTYVNNSLCEMLDYSQDEMIGKPWYFFFDEENRKIVENHMFKRRKGEKSSYEAAWLKNAEQKIHTIISGQPIFNFDGKYIGAFAIITDITERKQAEEALQESEERWRSLVENAPNFILIMDRDGKIQFLNRGGPNLNIEEFIGKNIYEFADSEFHTIIRETIKHVFQTGETGRHEVKGSFIDQIFWFEIQIGPIKHDEQVVAVMLVATDITERKQADQQLKESEEQFKMIAEQSLMGILILQDDLIKYANKAALTITGYSIKEMMEWPPNYFIKFIHPEDAAFVKEQATIKQAGGSGGIFHYHARIFSKLGKIIWISVFSKTVSYQGKPADLVTIVNITKRKETERKLRESEEHFKMITEQSLMGIIIVQNGLTKYVNDAASTITGYSIKEMMEWPPNYFIELVHPEDAAFVREQATIKQTGGSGAILHYYTKIISNSGKIKWLSIYSKTVSYQGKPADLVTLIDITKRKETERKLRESEEHFKTISEQALMGICIIQDNIIKYVNYEYAKIFGYSIKEMLSWGPLEYMKAVHPEDKKIIIEKERNKYLPETDYSIQYSFRGIKKSGEVIWLDNYSKIIEYRGRAADLSMITDITAKMNAERNLKESEKLYREAFNRAEFYKDLLSHDVSNILQSIIFTAESGLLMLDDRERLKSKLNDIKDQVKRSSKIISSVRKLSILEKGPPPLYPLDILSFINESIKIIQKGVIEKKVKISLDIDQYKFYVQA